MQTRDESMMWYHGAMSRQMCDDVLVAEFEENRKVAGVFLVRESSSHQCKFVLSCYSNNRVNHFTIKQHADDAFFSLTNEKTVHGLDELIKYYQQSGDDSLSVNLSSFSFARGKLPPIEYCKQGNVTPLHRAVESHKFELAKQIIELKAEPINAKDENGRTALHLACMNLQSNIEFVNFLIANGASFLIRDWSGNNAFHYACRYNRRDIVQRIIELNKEVIQMRNSENHDVPLHLAAQFGHMWLVRLLLSRNAALRPVNKAGKIPIDMACDKKFENIVRFLDRFKTIAKTSSNFWDHGTLSRTEAQKLLKSKRQQLKQTHTEELLSGLFLVRFSDKVKRHVITMLEAEDSKHYEIERTGDDYHLNQGPLFESLEHLITHYLEFTDGLATKLTIPVEPKPKLPKLSMISSSSAISNDSLDILYDPLPITPPDCISNPRYVNYFTRKDTESNIYSEIDEYCVAESFENDYVKLNKKSTPVDSKNGFDDLFIDDQNLEISSDQLGEGQFGSVFKGILVLPGRSCKVAIKTLHSDADGENVHKNFCSFLREAGTMMNFDNPFIVKMLGIVKGPPMRIVQQLQALGSLQTFLEDHGDEVTANDINIWANQIASGMEYLEVKRFVHRDLATRNILLASKTHCRISDFGLSRTISVENKTFHSMGAERVPVKWYAPECYSGAFSHASDVWSFGVTLWEAYSKGLEPYVGLSGQATMDFVLAGNRLDQPEICPDEIFDKMSECWNEQAELRPNFHKLAKFFKTNAPIYENRCLLVPSP